MKKILFLILFICLFVSVFGAIDFDENGKWETTFDCDNVVQNDDVNCDGITGWGGHWTFSDYELTDGVSNNWVESSTSNEWYYVGAEVFSINGLGREIVVGDTLYEWTYDNGTELGVLAEDWWDFGDNDFLGFDTIYIYHTTDPDDEINGRIRTSWAHTGYVPGAYASSITSVANNVDGLGGSGFRTIDGDGNVMDTGPLFVQFPEPQTELWIRWYMKHEAGYSWFPVAGYLGDRVPIAQKHIYIYTGLGGTASIAGFHGHEYTISTYGSSQYRPLETAGNKGWTGIMDVPTTGGPGDGEWHNYEVYFKMDTDGTDGVGRIWLDGVLVEENLAVNWSGLIPVALLGWDHFKLGENQGFMDSKGIPKAVDYDDLVVYNATPPNIDSFGNSFIGPITEEEPEVGICEATVGECYYVALNGLDSNNGSFNSPWQTPNKAWQDATAGDVVYFREGVFVMNQTVDTENANSGGTFENPVVFKNYIDENVTFVKNCSEGTMFEIQKEYNYIYGMNFICTDDDSEKVIFWFGDDVSGSYSRIENCTFEILSGTGSSNTNFIRLQGSNAKGVIIRNNKFTSFGDYASGVHVYRTNEFEVSNNEFYNLSRGVYVKHSNSLNGTDILVRNNVFKDCGSGVYGESNNAVYLNNLFINSNMNFGNNGGVGDGGVGGDNNVFIHNTFYNENFHFWLNGGIEEPYFCTGECNNTIRDNIYMKRSNMHPYNDVVDSNILDYNLYPVGNVINRNGVSYDLSAWKIFSGQDANSISDNPIFVGGSNPVDFEDFALTSSSPGYRFASDGTDIGANVSCVGIGRGGCEWVYVEEYDVDLNGNGFVDFGELVAVIVRYKDGDYTFGELLNFVNKWKDGEVV